MGTTDRSDGGIRTGYTDTYAIRSDWTTPVPRPGPHPCGEATTPRRWVSGADASAHHREEGTHVAQPQAYGATGSGEGSDTKQAAAEQGKQVKDEASQQARAVAGTAKDQASQVADEARIQARGLTEDAKQQMHRQARQQTDQLGGVIGQFGQRVEALASGRPEEAGPIGDYAGTIADQAQQIAGRVDELGFDGMVDEVQRFARRRPGMFLAAAAVAGFAVSRVGRGAKDASDGGASGAPSPGSLRTPPSATVGRRDPLTGDIDLTEGTTPPPVPAGSPPATSATSPTPGQAPPAAMPAEQRTHREGGR